MKKRSIVRAAVLLLAMWAAMIPAVRADVGQPSDIRISADKGYQVFG